MHSTLFATTTDNCVSVAEQSYHVLDTQVIANRELNEYLESQVNSIAPEILPIVPKVIQVEKVGITRNSSSTPYLVYSIEDRRHCIFFKRKLLWHLLQAFLKAQHKIEDKIRAVISTDCFDLKVMLGETWQTLFKPHVTKFVERWNNRASITAMPLAKPLTGYVMGARSAKACARNYRLIEMQRHKEQKVVISPAVEKLVLAMRNAIADQNWEILTIALYGNEQYKAEAWKQLSTQEQEQLRELTPPQVKMLAQARKAGKIAAFVEHEVSGIFFVWLHAQAHAETLTSSAVPSFLQNLA